MAPWTQNCVVVEDAGAEQCSVGAVLDTHSFHFDQCSGRRPHSSKTSAVFLRTLQATKHFLQVPSTFFQGTHTCVVKDAGADNLHSSVETLPIQSHSRTSAVQFSEWLPRLNTPFKSAPTTVFQGTHTCVVKDAGADVICTAVMLSHCQSNHTTRSVQRSFLSGCLDSMHLSSLLQPQFSREDTAGWLFKMLQQKTCTRVIP